MAANSGKYGEEEFQVMFADGVTSQFFAPGIVKFYFARSDPDPEAKAGSKDVPVAQVTMPVDGFIKMTAFFNHRLKTMVEAGIASQESIDASRVFWETNP